MNSNIASYIFLKIPAFVLFFVLASCAHIQDTQSISASGEMSDGVARVCEGIYRGPRPGDLNKLKLLKVRTILDLENNASAVSHEKVSAMELGIKVINIPMSNITRPKPDDLEKAVKIMEDPGLQPVYVHCLHGRDRTGFAVAAYRVLHDGWPVDQAYREAIDHGHTWWFYDLFLRWKKSLRALSAEEPAGKAPGRDRLSTPVANAS